MSEVAQTAPAVNSIPNESAPQVESQQSSPQQPIDVEIELDEGLKLKKSELTQRIKRQKELERGSYERFQKASQIEKQFTQLQEAIKGDPAKFLKDYGIEPEEFAKSLLEKKVKYLEMTPEQKRIAELEQQINQQKEEREQFEKKQQQERYSQEVAKYEQYFDHQITEAMKVTSLPKTPGAVKRMAEKLEVYLANQIPVDIVDVAREVKQDYIDEYGSILPEWDDDSLKSVLKDKAAERVRNLFLSEVKTPTQQKQESSKQPRVQTSSRRNRQTIGLTELNKKFEQMNRR